MKKNKIKQAQRNSNENKPIEVSAQDISLIRARETSRIRRSNIQWL